MHDGPVGAVDELGQPHDVGHAVQCAGPVGGGLAVQAVRAHQPRADGDVVGGHQRVGLTVEDQAPLAVWAVAAHVRRDDDRAASARRSGSVHRC